jgi:hypothetical protein
MFIRWLEGFGSPRRPPRHGAPNGLTLLLNRDFSELGSLASASTPERSAAAKSEAGCPHPQRVEQPVEQPLEEPVEQPLEQDYGGR